MATAWVGIQESYERYGRAEDPGTCLWEERTKYGCSVVIGHMYYIRSVPAVGLWFHAARFPMIEWIVLTHSVRYSTGELVFS